MSEMTPVERFLAARRAERRAMALAVVVIGSLVAAVLALISYVGSALSDPPNTDPRTGWVSIPSPEHDGMTIGRKACEPGGTGRMVYEFWTGATQVQPAAECGGRS